MQTNVYTVWGNCKDLLTEKKFLAYQHSEIQDRNRMALLVGGFTILLVGLSDFLRTNHQLFLTISITIRILFFLFCLFSLLDSSHKCNFLLNNNLSIT
ncbi:MAG TPA: hypothetical protein PLS12_04790, partial [Bacteroidales bacterium]|nr:hypothetical protein [Bacteroidales bacterium]